MTRKSLPVIFTITLLSVFSLTGTLLSAASLDKYKDYQRQFENAAPPPYYQKIKDRKLIQPTERPQYKNTINDYFDSTKKLGQHTGQSDFIQNFSSLSEDTITLNEKINYDPVKIEKYLVKELELDLLTALSLTRNPGLAAALEKKNAAFNQYSQVANLQEILNQYLSFTEAVNTRVGPKQNTRMINMNYPFPGMLTLRGKVIDQEVALADNAYHQKARNLITQIKNSYYQLEYLERSENISNKTLGLLSSMKDISQTLFKTGKAQFNDVINVQMKIDKQKEKLATINQNKEITKDQFRKHLNLSDKIVLGKTVESGQVADIPATDELIDLGLKNNLEINAIRIKLEKMKLMITVMEKMFYPDFASPNSYFQNRENNMIGSSAKMASFPVNKVTNPDPWYGKNDAYIKELKNDYQAMKLNLADRQISLRQEIKQTILEIDEGTRKRTLFQDVLIPQANQALEVSQSGYQTGKVNFADLLITYNQWLEYQLEYYMAIRNIKQKTTALEKLISLNIKNMEKRDVKK